MEFIFISLLFVGSFILLAYLQYLFSQTGSPMPWRVKTKDELVRSIIFILVGYFVCVGAALLIGYIKQRRYETERDAPFNAQLERIQKDIDDSRKNRESVPDARQPLGTH